MRQISGSRKIRSAKVARKIRHRTAHISQSLRLSRRYPLSMARQSLRQGHTEQTGRCGRIELQKRRQRRSHRKNTHVLSSIDRSTRLAVHPSSNGGRHVFGQWREQSKLVRHTRIGLRRARGHFAVLDERQDGGAARAVRQILVLRSGQRSVVRRSGDSQSLAAEESSLARVVGRSQGNDGEHSRHRHTVLHGHPGEPDEPGLLVALLHPSGKHGRLERAIARETLENIQLIGYFGNGERSRHRGKRARTLEDLTGLPIQQSRQFANTEGPHLGILPNGARRRLHLRLQSTALHVGIQTRGFLDAERRNVKSSPRHPVNPQPSTASQTRDDYFQERGYRSHRDLSR